MERGAGRRDAHDVLSEGMGEDVGCVLSVDVSRNMNAGIVAHGCCRDAGSSLSPEHPLQLERVLITSAPACQNMVSAAGRMEFTGTVVCSMKSCDSYRSTCTVLYTV